MSRNLKPLLNDIKYLEDRMGDMRDQELKQAIQNVLKEIYRSLRIPSSGPMTDKTLFKILADVNVPSGTALLKNGEGKTVGKIINIKDT